MSEPLVSIEPTQASTLERLRFHFPFPTVRDMQGEALGVIASALDDRKPFSIVEAPTGTGKSGLSIALAGYAGSLRDNTYLPGAYILTSQKSLSAQLLRDFGHLGLVEMKGRSNYTCVAHHTNCDHGAALNKLTLDEEKRAEAKEGCAASEELDLPELQHLPGVPKAKCGRCPYKAAKQAFIDSTQGVTNYSYFITETSHAGKLLPRQVLVLDEAHNVEKEVIGLVDIKVTKRRCEELGIRRPPIFEPKDEAKTLDWLNQILVPVLKTKITSYTAEALKARLQKGGEEESVRWSKKANALEVFADRITMYSSLRDRRNWISWTDREGDLNIKPLSGADFAQSMLFDHGRHVLMMSATILDFKTFERNLGIAPGAASRFACPSEFPEENRPIVFWPVGNMAYKDIDATLPKMCQRVDKILSHYPKLKGIIHTHTYRINKELVDYLETTEHNYRIITHSSETGSREAAVNDHCSSPEPTVLLSPSMTEGLDLKDDLSRFQIVCKVPYPFLDTYTRARMERDPAWYQLQTALCLVQSTGRSIRSATDFATTFILDSGFERFLMQNQAILPDWWKDAISFK